MIERLVLHRPDDLDDFDPRLDVATPGELRQVLVVASSQRTGSNMLCTALAATGVAGVPGEYLSGFDNLADAPSFARARSRFGLPVPTRRGALGMLKRRLAHDPHWYTCHRWQPESIHRMVDAVVNVRTTPNGVFAVKVHASDYSRVRSTTGFHLGQLGAPLRWVLLERDDLLAQTVSYTIAMQTRRWSSYSRTPAGVEPRYDADQIETGLRRMRANREWWRHYFQDEGIVPLRLTYEGLLADFAGAATAVLGLVGETCEVVPPPATERQGSGRNREWIDRFRADRPDVVAELT